jgi:hypothetical protein
MANQKKHVVAPGCSFVGNKKSFKAGDEITKEDFKDEKYFNALISAKKIVSSSSDSIKEDEDDLSDVDISNISKDNVKRDQLEKLILEKGFLTEEKMKKFSDENLIKFAVKKGIVGK